MKWHERYRWYLVLGIALVILSGILYLLHYAIFKDPHHIFIYMLGDIAFLPIEVLLVVLIVHRVLDEREKRSRMEHLNLVIGAFFSEVGTTLLDHLYKFDTECEEIEGALLFEADWAEEDFKRASRSVQEHECRIGRRDEDLEELRDFLLSRRQFLLTLLENPNLLEHETFTDLLWAVFHLTEELKFRDILEGLPDEDYEHLCGDVARAYTLLIREWLAYMKHLKQDYPYLYSLAVRTNPFDPEASPIID